MKKYLILIAIFMVLCVSEGVNATEVKKIDLNLTEDEISFTFFDLPSGEATLIQSGSGEDILINSGGPNSTKQLLNNLRTYRIESLDSIVITNEGLEYCSNVSEVVEKIPTEQLIVPKSLSTKLEGKDERPTIRTWQEGDKHEILPGLLVKVLNDDENTKHERGMVLTFSFGENNLLYMGVTSDQIEDKVKKLIVDQEIKILKVPEFAEEGTKQTFLESIKPQMAVIFHRKEKLPSMNIIERLNETWIDIYQTHQFGTVTVKLDKKTYEVITIDSDES